ncbi:MAG: ABC transporter permease subunit [Solirubrobacteraceae bacterium]|nr:ABC transporter permease subunit [Solirubrobacteraceae bacterium]
MAATAATPPRASAVRPRLLAAGRLLTTGGLGVLGIAMIFGFWALVASITNSGKFPKPLDVLQAIPDDLENIPAVSYVTFQQIGLQGALEYTTVNVLVTVAIGTLIGLPLGILMARVRTARQLLEPPLLVLGTVPLLIILPFITLWFGTARFAQSGLVLIFTILTVTMAAQSAAETVSGHYANFSACLGASKTRELWSVVLPASIPNVLGAIRVALAAAWGWQCIAELLGAETGVGRIIGITSDILATTDLFATLFCLVVVAVICDAIVAAVGAYITRWKE